MPIPSSLVAAALLFLTTKYWLAPITLRFRHRVGTGRNTMHPVSPEHPLLPALIAPLDEGRIALEALGFRSTPTVVSDIGGAVQLFEQPTDRAVAALLVLPSGGPSGGPFSLVGYTTQLRDGTLVRTGNGHLPSVFPALPRVAGARFPAELDPTRLYALHRARVRRHASPAVTLRVGDPAAYQQREEDTARRWWIESGYVYEDGGAMRPTWRGAFGMPWRLLFPWKHVGEWRDERLRRRLLPEAGLA